MKKVEGLSDPRNGWYEVAPSDAAQILETGVTKNRPVSEWRAAQLAKEITAGRFTPNGESVIFDSTGRLADGQHRFRACVISGKPIVVFAVYMPPRLPMSFFDSIDAGRARSLSHRLSMEGAKNAILLASIVRHLCDYDAGTDSHRGNASIHVARKRYEQVREEADAAAALASSFKENVAGWMPASVLGFVFMMASRKNKTKALAWARSVATGEDISRGSPIGLLRSLLQGDAMKGSRRYSRPAILSLATKSWLFYLRNQAPKLLKWAPGEKTVRFDDLEEVA